MKIDPANDFLTNYLFYVQGNEVPQAYHLWSAIAALSVLVGRGVWMDFGIFTTHCNLYVVLVGDPSSKKSTAMEIAMGVVRDCGIKLAPASVTKQRIYELMDKANVKGGYLSSYSHDEVMYPVARFPMFCNEMVTMLSAGGDPLGMVEFLTDIWSRSMFDTDTKHAGSNMILGPYLTILGCMTPGQTSSLLKQDIITGGFSRRCILVTPDRTRPIAVPFPETTQAQEHARQQCIRIGKELMEVVTPFTLSNEARATYVNWYEMNHEREGRTQSDILLYFYGTLKRYILQVGMLLELSANRSSRTVSDDNIRRAIAWLEPIQHNLQRIFAGAGRNIAAMVAAKIITILERAGGPLSKKAIHLPIFNDAPQKEFDEALAYLINNKLILSSVDPSLPASSNIVYRLPDQKSAATPLAQTSSHTFELDLAACSYPMPSDYQPVAPPEAQASSDSSAGQVDSVLQSLEDIDLSDLADLNLDTMQK